MAIVEKTVCDICMYNGDEDANAESNNNFKLALDGVTYSVDLCPPHSIDFDMYASAIRECSRIIEKEQVAKIDTPKKAEPLKGKAARLTCAECGFKGRTIGGLHSHQTKKGHR